MCGFGGIVNFGYRTVEEQCLQDMSASIEYRGRDYIGYRIEQNVGVFHNRLSIIDLSPSGNQPLITEDKKVWLLFNGEIFNYVELRIKLEKKGHQFKGNSDTEVLLHTYLEYETECVQFLDGMFSFAIIDFNKNKLLLFRDQVGIKPLYYTINKNCLIFASEVKAILASHIIKPELDYFGLKSYINTQLYLPGMTLFKGIQAVKPGCYLESNLTSVNVNEKKYWDFPVDNKKYGLSYDECLQELNDIAKLATRNWSRADVEIGAHISGGIDSSLVASLTQMSLKEDNKNLRTFSSIYSGYSIQDESHYSNIVAKHINSEHHAVELNKQRIAQIQSNIAYLLDYPIAGFSAPYLAMSEFVRNYVKVVMTGHGGDELFCGYPKYIIGALAKVLRTDVQNVTFDWNSLKYIKGFEKQAREILGKSAFASDYQIVTAMFNRGSDCWNFINPDIQEKIKDFDIFQEIVNLGKSNNNNILNQILLYDKKMLLPALLHVEDRTSMAANLESRTPLLSKSVLEFSSSIPENFLLKNGLKSLLRDLSKKYLPKEIANNPNKSGVLYPAMELESEEIKENMEASLRYLDSAGIFRTSAKTILSNVGDLVNKRKLWGFWSLGSWLASYKVSI